jgi:hypothetical protein
MEQLTKKELRNLEVGQIISEKILNKVFDLKVEKIESGQIPVFHLVDINSKKRTKLIVSENFNKEGDRKHKSKLGSIIIKYYNHGNNNSIS